MGGKSQRLGSGWNGIDAKNPRKWGEGQYRGQPLGLSWTEDEE